MCEEMLVSPGEDPRGFLCGTPQHEMDRSPLGPSLEAPADKPNGCAHHKAGNQTCTEDPPKNELNEGASWRISLNGTRCEDAAPDLLGLCPSAGVRVVPFPFAITWRVSLLNTGKPLRRTVTSRKWQKL
jgi:hypothetical protein